MPRQDRRGWKLAVTVVLTILVLFVVLMVSVGVAAYVS